MPWYWNHTFHYCIRGHCFLMGQHKCSFLSLWLLYRWLGHDRPRCIIRLSEIAGWSSRRVYFLSLPPISSTQSLAFSHYRTIFLQMPLFSTIITSSLLNAASEMVHLTLLTPRSLCVSRWDEGVVYAFWKVPLFLNHDSLPLIHAPLWNVAWTHIPYW